ncbi:MAG: Rrf2 family transcriptional regulator [Saprospiraceae bacterium]|nr:Rrf2 family transcriptional regulator [Candidatus Brachybacter algidus]
MRAVIYIAKESTIEHKVGLDNIAQAINSPRYHTSKIMQQLTTGDGHIVSSIRGPGGGFYLTEQDKKRAIIDILRTMGEDQMLDRCVLGLNVCSDINPCAMHRDYKVIKKQLISYFKLRQ